MTFIQFLLYNLVQRFVICAPSLFLALDGRGVQVAEVVVKEGETLDGALRRFKKQCSRAGVIAEVRKREAYEKPSVKRKKKSEAARRKKKR